MAKPVSEEELQLKKRARRRLVGAIALVAAVAAVLPMVLDSEPKPTARDINIQIPPPDTKAVAVVPPKVVAVSPEKAAAKKAEAPAVETPAPKPAAADKPAAKTQAAEKPAAKPAAADKPLPVPDNPNDAVLLPRIVRENAAAQEKPAAKRPEKAADKAPEKAAAPKAGPGAFFIQVMALSDTEKAKQLQRQIAGAGVRVYTEVVSADAGKITRVRAGPFATREEAESARGKLQGIGLEGKVAAY